MRVFMNHFRTEPITISNTVLHVCHDQIFERYYFTTIQDKDSAIGNLIFGMCKVRNFKGAMHRLQTYIRVKVNGYL